MPHSLYLGSGIVQPRLREYDDKHGLLAVGSGQDEAEGKARYVPSTEAVRHSLKYSLVELALALLTFALFVNSAILVVAGASLYGNEEALEADIFGIHDLLVKSISPAAGTIFSLALLLSGISAGIVCTIAGQMVSEGALQWRVRPWLRRLITRSISITPSIIVAGAVGRPGLNAALTGSQVALSSVLPFVTIPLVYFTGRSQYMTMGRPTAAGRARRRDGSDDDGGEDEEEEERRAVVAVNGEEDEEEDDEEQEVMVDMSNPRWLTAVAALVWLIITVMNVANLVLLAMGRSAG